MHLPPEKQRLHQTICDGQKGLSLWIRDQEVVVQARGLYEDALKILSDSECIYWRRLEPPVGELNSVLANGHSREEALETIERLRGTMDWLMV